MREQLSHYIRAGYSGLYLVSHEEQRVEAEIKAVANGLQHQLFAWSITEGLIDTTKGTARECNDPMEVLNVVTELPENSILLLRDFHQFFDDPNPVLIRRLKDQLRESRTTGKTLVVLGCRLNLPPELEREFTVIDIALPGFDELSAVLMGITESTEQKMPKPEIVSDLVDAARGMTTTEAENAFALSVVESGGLNATLVARE